MSSWLELEQQHKNKEKIEIKDKLLQLNRKIKNLELSFKDTLETLNNESFSNKRESFIKKPPIRPQSYITRPIEETLKNRIITQKTSFHRTAKSTYKEYIEENKLKY